MLLHRPRGLDPITAFPLRQIVLYLLTTFQQVFLHRTDTQAHALGNLIYLFDDNRITIDGGTDLTFREDVAQRFESHGWHVSAVDGEDHEGLSSALAAAREEAERPSLIITRTLIGHGSPNFAGKSKAHGGPLGDDENRATKEQLGWPVDSELLVPDEVRAYCNERAEAKKQERQARDTFEHIV